jgi:hypothetical protein
MKLEAGKHYVTRDGWVGGPLKETGSKKYPYCDDNDATWDEDGFYLNPSEHRASDFVRLATPEEIAAGCALLDTPEPAATVKPEPVSAIPGITWRDFFAGMALAGFLAMRDFDPNSKRSLVAARCIEMADALLAALEKEEA